MFLTDRFARVFRPDQARDQGRGGRGAERLEGRTLFATFSITDLAALPATSTSPLVRDAAGDFFGVTPAGGASGVGSIYGIQASTNTVATVASFDGTAGVTPDSLAIDSAGNLFGTTRFSNVNGADVGGGTVFELPVGSTTIDTLGTFTGDTLGANPAAIALDSSGDIFGVNTTGGVAGGGTLFEYDPTAGAINVLASFGGGTEGSTPNTLALSGGMLYGTTLVGGTNNAGAVFSYDPGTGTATTLADFDSPTQGSDPLSAPVVDASGNLFGTTSQGGPNSLGTVYEIPAGGTAVNVLASFSSTTGSNPAGNLVLDSSDDLFGATQSGTGNVYEVVSNSGTITPIAAFAGSDSGPASGLIDDASGNLFGTTTGGGANGVGVLYEVPGAASTTTGTTPTGTASVLTTVARSTLPTAAVGGVAAKGTVVVTITNNGTATSKGADSLTLYASTDRQIDSSSVQLAAVSKKLALPASKSINLPVAVKGFKLPVGTYTILGRFADTTDAITSVSVGPTLAVAAPYVSLSAAARAVSPITTSAGKSVSFTLDLSNAGNVVSSGAATIAIGLSADGSTQAIAVSSATRSVAIKPGKTIALRLKLKVPMAAAGMSLFPIVTFSQAETENLVAVGSTAITISA